MGRLLRFLGLETHRARTLALIQRFFIRPQHFILYLGVLIIAHLRNFLHLRQAALNALQVFELEFGVDNHFIAYRVHAAVYVHYVIVVKAAQDVNNGICLANIT